MKRFQMHPMAAKHNKLWVYVPMGWIGSVRSVKLQHEFVARTFALIAPVHPVLHQISRSNEMIPNATRQYENGPKY